MSWRNLGLHQWINDQLSELKICEPNEIQSDCIPEILNGKDCIGCAKTGSGKTAVFALPILQRLSEDPFGICALILTPTRELASQIADQFNAFGKSIRVKVSLVVGGESSTLQSINLSHKPHVVVATPGRLASLLREKSDYFHFKKLKFLVLDEVDALLAAGDLEKDITEILKALPSADSRQTLAFSATSSGIIGTLRKTLKPTLHFFESSKHVLTAENLIELYLPVASIAKDALLIYILQQKLNLLIEVSEKGGYTTNQAIFKNINEIKQAIIFSPSVWQCHVLGRLLEKLGFSCSILHSALSQGIRIRNLTRFRSKHTRILVSTSLAGRGLDIPCVDLVINYSLPFSSDEYIHHVGRTARANRSGTAITFIAPFETDILCQLETVIGKKLTLLPIENQSEAEKFVKCCSLMRKEISTNLYINEESMLNRKIEKRKKIKKTNNGIKSK